MVRVLVTLLVAGVLAAPSLAQLEIGPDPRSKPHRDNTPKDTYRLVVEVDGVDELEPGSEDLERFKRATEHLRGIDDERARRRIEHAQKVLSQKTDRIVYGRARIIGERAYFAAMVVVNADQWARGEVARGDFLGVVCHAKANAKDGYSKGTTVYGRVSRTEISKSSPSDWEPVGPRYGSPWRGLDLRAAAKDRRPATFSVQIEPGVDYEHGMAVRQFKVTNITGGVVRPSALVVVRTPDGYFRYLTVLTSGGLRPGDSAMAQIKVPESITDPLFEFISLE